MDKKLEDILNAKGVSVYEHGLSAPATIREHIEKLEDLKEKFGENAYLVADSGYNNITHEIKTPQAIKAYQKEVEEKEKNRIKKMEEKERKELQRLQKKYKKG